MGIFGKILSTPIRLINAPIRALEDIVSDGEEMDEEKRLVGSPLEKLAKQVDRVDGDDE